MRMNLTPNEYRTLLRRDLYAFTERCFYELHPTTEFLPNWHIEVGSSRLEACQRGEIQRLILNQPPRSLKSLLASVSFVAFLLGHDPTAQIICASYGQDLANKHAMDCRTILNSAWYQIAIPAYSAFVTNARPCRSLSLRNRDFDYRRPLAVC